MKKICGFFIGGMCTAFGYLTAVKIVETCSDPYKRKRMRNKIQNIKNEICKKD